MNVDVDLRGVDLKMQDTERKFVLHQILPIPFFHRLTDQRAADVPSIDIKDLIIPVGPVDHRFPQKASDMQSVFLMRKRRQLIGNILAIDPVNNLQKLPVSCGIKTILTVHNELEGNFRVGHGKMFHQVGNVRSLCLRLLEKFLPGGRVVEQIPYHDGGAVRGADLLQLFLNAAVNTVSYSKQFIRRFCDQLDHGNGRNAGKCLPTKAKTDQVSQIICGADLAGGMPEKGVPNL